MADSDYDVKETLLGNIKSFLIFFAIYLYFAGWTYDFILFKEFGLSLNELDIPFYYFLMYSFPVVADHIIFVTSLLIAGGVLIYFSGTFWGRIILPVSLLLLFPTTYLLSVNTAKSYAGEIRLSGGGDRLPIRFHLKKIDALKLESDMEGFHDLNKKWKLKLLTQTSQNYYALYAYKTNTPEAGLPLTRVFIIPVDSIARAETRKM